MTEAEYIALSTCATELLPLCAILTEIIKHGPVDHDVCNLQETTKSTLTTHHMSSSRHNAKLAPSIIYKDYIRCIVLTTEPDQNRPAHWYKIPPFQRPSPPWTPKGDQNPTALNWADIFTKPLVHTKFLVMHKMLMGW